jgi:hypothetical protein
VISVKNRSEDLTGLPIAPHHQNDYARIQLPRLCPASYELRQHQPFLFWKNAGGLFHRGCVFPIFLGDERAAFRREFDQARKNSVRSRTAWFPVC